MAEKQKMPWPAWALALDIVGAVFFALGLIVLFGADPLGIPEINAFRSWGTPLIVLGVLLMVPLIYFTISSIRSSK